MRKTMKISEVIKRLQEFKKTHGDLPVYLLRETNKGYRLGTLNRDNCFYWSDHIDKKDKYAKILTIQPYEEKLYVEDLGEE